MTEPEATFSKIVADRIVRAREESGAPLEGVEIVRIASNGTFIDGVTDENGEWSYVEPFLGTVTVLAAGSGWDGAIDVLEWDQWSGTLDVQLHPAPEGGSMIIRQGSGYVPGLEGRLNPIRDTKGRTYIYGDNLSFNESPEQPFQFVVGAPFTASDATGNVFVLTVLGILGRTTLIRYRLETPSPLKSQAVT